MYKQQPAPFRSCCVSPWTACYAPKHYTSYDCPQWRIKQRLTTQPSRRPRGEYPYNGLMGLPPAIDVVRDNRTNDDNMM